MSADYLNQLNDQQRDAVEYLDGPQLVIAGAGSGKTRVLTYKIVHLLARGYEPSRIMALTFTNKAAREMKERINAIAGNGISRRIWMGTFHSIFSRILRQNSDKIGYTSNYTIYDTTDSRSLIKNIIKDMGLDEKWYKPATVQNAISWAKNSLVSPTAYGADRQLVKSDSAAGRGRIVDIYQTYMMRCRLADAMDFDDLLYYTAFLFRDNPGILGHYREFFRYFLVDEFQDTNFAQNVIVSQLAMPAGNVCVVGDDAQSIYSFRGANINNILDMERTYHGLKVFKLEQNYRSTRNITNASNSLIAHNNRRMHKEVFSTGDIGEPVEVQAGHSDYDEAGLVASRIVTRRAATGDSFNEFAILYRTNAQSRVLEEALRRRDIPYRIYGGQVFYQRKEVKDAVAYMRLSVNPRDDEALRRVINVPARGIGKTTLDRVVAAAMAANISIWDVLTDLANHDVNVNSGTANKLKKFVEMIQCFMGAAHNLNAEELTTLILNVSGLFAMYRSDSTPENVSKYENLEELVNGAHSFVEDHLEEGDTEHLSMADFLTEVSLATDMDEADDPDAERVTLMTIHASKGLEFANVFVVGVEEDLLPSSLSHDSEAAVEEERRLFYVAMTRAKKFCMLSYALSRYLNGQTMLCRPSRFFGDIDDKFLKYSYGAERTPFIIPKRPQQASSFAASRSTFTPPAPIKPATPAPSPADFAVHPASRLNVGMAIVHPKFGKGSILSMGDEGMGDFIIVDFAGEQRKLLLKYAKFRIL